MAQWRFHAAGWLVFLIAAAIRPGIDLLDRRLVERCWDIPSEWNAVADAAINTGVVDPDINGVRAPWRQASVLPVGGSRVAVVTVSDMSRARATFITERYQVVGVLTRTTTDPVLVTDEARGYKALSHIWPLVKQDDRLQTLISLTPLRSDPPLLGVFAYVALGAQENELLFVCRLVSVPGPTLGELVRADVNGDGFEDFVVYLRAPRDQRASRVIATFIWDPRMREYATSITDEGRPIVAWWSSAPGDRVTVPRTVPVDEAILKVAARLDGRDRLTSGIEDGRQKVTGERTSGSPGFH